MRLIRVPIWMSCTGCMNTLRPGIAPSRSVRRRAICMALAARALRGVSASVSRPVLGVGLMVPTPTKLTTPATSGSPRTISAACSCNTAMRGIDTPGSASVTATISPVSCNGRNPLGTMI